MECHFSIIPLEKKLLSVPFEKLELGNYKEEDLDTLFAFYKVLYSLDLGMALYISLMNLSVIM